MELAEIALSEIFAHQQINKEFKHFVHDWLTRSNIDPDLLINEGYLHQVLTEIESLNWLKTDNLADDDIQNQIAQFIDLVLNITMHYHRFLKVAEVANEY